MKTFREFVEAIDPNYWQKATLPTDRKIAPMNPNDPEFYSGMNPTSYQQPRPSAIPAQPQQNPNQTLRMAGESDDQLLQRVGPKVYSQITGKVPQGMPASTPPQQLPNNATMQDLSNLGQGERVQPQQKSSWFNKLLGR